MNKNGLDIGTIASIVDLIKVFIVSRAVWSSEGEERCLGGGEELRMVVRWSMKLFQSVAQKSCVGCGTFPVRGTSSVVRMGRWSMLGPCRS